MVAEEYSDASSVGCRFHHEVARNLTASEFWNEGERDGLVDLIQTSSSGGSGWNYRGQHGVRSVQLVPGILSADLWRFSTEDAYAILAEELGMGSKSPKDNSKIWNVPSSRRLKDYYGCFESGVDVGYVPSRCCKMDPANDATCRDEFANRYNRCPRSGRSARMAHGYFLRGCI